MAICEGNNQLCADIISALGLPDFVIGFEIHANVDCAIVARCEFYVTEEQLEKIQGALTEYKITAERIEKAK